MSAEPQPRAAAILDTLNEITRELEDGAANRPTEPQPQAPVERLVKLERSGAAAEPVMPRVELQRLTEPVVGKRSAGRRVVIGVFVALAYVAILAVAGLFIANAVNPIGNRGGPSMGERASAAVLTMVDRISALVHSRGGLAGPAAVAPIDSPSRVEVEPAAPPTATVEAPPPAEPAPVAAAPAAVEEPPPAPALPAPVLALPKPPAIVPAPRVETPAVDAMPAPVVTAVPLPAPPESPPAKVEIPVAPVAPAAVAPPEPTAPAAAAAAVSAPPPPEPRPASPVTADPPVAVAAPKPVPPPEPAAPSVTAPVVTAPANSAAGQELRALGNARLMQGDVASARLFYERAADAGDARAALLLGGTYDPAFLAQLGAQGMRGDAAQAALWYRRARELGDAEAAERLKAMGPR